MASEARQKEDVGFVSSEGSDSDHMLRITGLAAVAQLQHAMSRTKTRGRVFIETLLPLNLAGMENAAGECEPRQVMSHQ